MFPGLESINIARLRSLRPTAEFFMSTNTTLVELTHISDEQELRELERKYCSWGDTVHYLEPPKFSIGRRAAISTIARERLILICRCGIRRPALDTATNA